MSGRRRRGFTLVELMIVLVILGLAAGAVVVTLPPPEPSLAREAERFAAKLARAQELAIVANRPVAVRLDERGYRFEERTGGLWRPIASGPLAPALWVEGTAPDPGGEQRVGFDPTGLADPPLALRLTREGKTALVRVDPAAGVFVGDEEDQPASGP